MCDCVYVNVCLPMSVLQVDFKIYDEGTPYFTRAAARRAAVTKQLHPFLNSHIAYTHTSLPYPFCFCLNFLPIPVAFLVNEARVRDIIVNEGWIEGLKAIFYSATKIRNLEREKISNNLKDKKGDSIGHNEVQNRIMLASSSNLQESTNENDAMSAESNQRELGDLELSTFNALQIPKCT